jgi:molybdate-binding protein
MANLPSFENRIRVQLIALERTSRTSLTLLGQGLVHVAGVHMASADQPAGNAGVVRSELGLGYCLLRAALWEEGIAVTPSRRLSSVRATLWSGVAWIGRERGSGARQCLDELLGPGRAAPPVCGVESSRRRRGGEERVGRRGCVPSPGQ